MKKIWRKQIAALLCLIACLGLVSGCGKSSQSGTTASSSEATASSSGTTASSSEATTGESGSSASIAEPSDSSGETSSVETPESLLADILPLNFAFSSGAGAWETELTLQADGSFSGVFHDTDMGDIGEGYPDGTVYTSEFSGQFGDIKKLDDHTYSLTLTELNTQGTVGEEDIDGNSMRYITAEPYGVESGKAFLLYTPDTPLEGLNEEFLSWRLDRESTSTLGCYGLYNVETGYGFFTYG